MNDQNKIYADMKSILEKNGYWYNDIAYAIDIGKIGCEKSYRVFFSKVYSYDMSTGLIPSEIHFALGLASMILVNRLEVPSSENNTHDIPPDWFTSEEARIRREKIKISSQEISKHIVNSSIISDDLLKKQINPHKRG